MGLITNKKTVSGIELVTVKAWPEPSLDQSIPKTENNYYETKIGDAIDEPPPVNPIPDRKGELDETLDIEEYIEMSRDDADDIEADLQRREQNEE